MKFNFKKILQFALADFNRNKGISAASIFILTIMILLVSGLYLSHGVTSYLISQIENKIDITAYFKEDTSGDDVMKAKDSIAKLIPDLKNVEYVSKETALADFQKKHQDNQILANALQEVGGNPFLPSLNITTNGDPATYQKVADVLQSSDFSQIIEKVDFSEKKDIIERVYSISSRINNVLIALSLILFAIAVMIVFNTIKLAIDSSKEEINTMRIVGASDWFIRGPFIICGALYGLAAFVISFIFCLILAYSLSHYIAFLLPGFNLFSFVISNILILVLIQLGSGVLIGILSSFVVVRKYLK